MAERRMFAKTIIDSDAFIDMPVTARLLYYDLGMRADDDGFINAPKKIMRMIGASEDDMRILIARKFIIPFESGVVVIKHWRIHNYIQSDRYKETNYKEELAELELDENKAYRLPANNVDTECIQNVYTLDTQVRLGKESLGKESLGKSKSKRFIPPTPEEVQEYCDERNNNINGQHFCDYYQARGWALKTGPMKDWKATVRTWEKNVFTKQEKQKQSQIDYLKSQIGGGL